MITFGFYNSVDHDRRYDAIQFGSMFDGIVRDGIFMSIGTCFRVIPMKDMSVLVGAGRAWFNHTWTLNDAPLVMEIPQSEILSDRIDAIILDIDANPESRKNDIILIKGIPSKTPQAPVLINDSNHHQYPLAYILVEAGATSIRAADITSMIGTSQTPYVTGILETVNIDALLDQWKDQWQEFYEDQTEEMQETYDLWKTETEAWSTNYKGDMEEWQQTQEAEMEAWADNYKNEMETWREEQQTEFNEWFDELQVTLEPDAAANLANGILGLKKNFKNLEKHAILDSSYVPTSDDSEDDSGDNDNNSGGANIKDLEEVESITPGDALLIGSTIGNRKITLLSDIYDTYDRANIPVEMRRNIWRGKFLGNTITDEQWSEINNGTFKGLFIGDYWMLNGLLSINSAGYRSNTPFRIVDFDYWYGKGGPNETDKCNIHHAVIMPDNVIYRNLVPDDNMESNGYINGTLRNAAKTFGQPVLDISFGSDHILHYKNRFILSVLDNNKVYEWVDASIELPSQIMINGVRHYVGNADVPYQDDGSIDKEQLAGCRLRPFFNGCVDDIYLRDIINSNYLCYLSHSGYSSYPISKTSSNSKKAIRPVFGIHNGLPDS